MDDPSRERALTGSRPPLIPGGLDATLVLVRHGESTFIVEERFQGQADTPLSPTGLRQAGLVAHRLANAQEAPALPLPIQPPIELVHSPLRRTTETAEAVDEAFRATRVTVGRRADPAFLEIAQGDWEGLLRSEVEARYGALLRTWRSRPLEAWAPGGESLPEVQSRLRPGLASVLTNLAAAGSPGSPDRSPVAGYRDAPVDHPWSVVVGHDGVFKVTLLTLFDLPLDRFWMWSMDLCGVSVVEFRGGRPVLRAHNLTAHLAGLLDEEAQAELEERSRSGAL